MNSISDICYIFKYYNFTSKLIDASAAAHFYFRQGLSYAQVAEKLNAANRPSDDKEVKKKPVTEKQVYDCIYYNTKGDKGILVDLVFATRDLKEYLLTMLYEHLKPVDESFIPPMIRDKTYIINLLSETFPMVPTKKNIHTPASKPPKFTAIEKKIFPLIDAKNYVLLDDLLNLPFFKDCDHKLNFYKFVFSRYKTLYFKRYKDKSFVIKNTHEAILQFLFDHSITPVGHDDLLFLLEDETGIKQKSITRLLSRCSGIYRLTGTLYGREKDLFYPDKVNEIQQCVRNLLAGGGVENMDKVAEHVVKGYPLLKSRHELRSILRGCPDIIINNKLIFLKEKVK